MKFNNMNLYYKEKYLKEVNDHYILKNLNFEFEFDKEIFILKGKDHFLGKLIDFETIMKNEEENIVTNLIFIDENNKKYSLSIHTLIQEVLSYLERDEFDYYDKFTWIPADLILKITQLKEDKKKSIKNEIEKHKPTQEELEDLFREEPNEKIKTFNYDPYTFNVKDPTKHDALEETVNKARNYKQMEEYNKNKINNDFYRKKIVQFNNLCKNADHLDKELLKCFEINNNISKIIEFDNIFFTINYIGNKIRLNNSLFELFEIDKIENIITFINREYEQVVKFTLEYLVNNTSFIKFHNK